MRRSQSDIIHNSIIMKITFIDIDNSETKLEHCIKQNYITEPIANIVKSF